MALMLCKSYALLIAIHCCSIKKKSMLTCLPSGVDKLKYQLQQWKMGTSLPARVKRTICKAIQRRRVKLDRSSIAKYRNQKVDPQKLRRWLQEEEAKSNFTLQPTASGSANNRRPISGQDLQLGGKT